VRYLQQNQNNVVVLVPPRRPASATLAFVSPSGTSLSSPAVTLDTLVGTVASVAAFSATVTVSAGALVAGRQYWVSSDAEGESLVLASTEVSDTITWQDMPATTVAVASTVRGARLTATIPSSVCDDLGQYFQLRWTVTHADGSVQTYLEAASVCRTVFRAPVTSDIAARHAGYAFPAIASQRKTAYWQEVAGRASRRVEQRILASGRMPHLVGDQSLLEDAGLIALRIELARDGLVPQGYEASQFVVQMEDELKMQMEWALSSTWHDTNDDGEVQDIERGGPKSILLVRT
jgi:hypothetical protein